MKTIIDFALPPRCPICGVTVDADNRFCLSCWQDLNFISEPWCASCGKPFAYAQAEGTKCIACMKRRPEHDGVRAVVEYDDKSSLLAMRLKYGVRLGLAELIAQHMARFLTEVPEETLVVPVPLHRWRLWSRGFNQSVLIGKALAKRNALDMNSTILVRRNATPPLRSMSAKKRRTIVGNAFRLSPDAEHRIAGKTIILVDDVYTTGSTANACAQILKGSGAKKVLVFCWARVLGDYDSS